MFSYSDMTADSLRTTIDCPFWPPESDRLNPAPSQATTTQLGMSNSISQQSTVHSGNGNGWPIPPTAGSVSMHTFVTRTLSFIAMLILSCILRL